MKFKLTILYCAIAFAASAQFKSVDLQLNINRPILPTLESTEPLGNSSGTVREEFNTSFGFSTAIIPTFKLSEKFDLKVGVGTDYFQFSRETDIISTDEQFTNPSETIASLTGSPLDVVYFNLPLGFSYKVFPRLQMGLGVQVNRRIYSKQKILVIESIPVIIERNGQLASTSQTVIYTDLDHDGKNLNQGYTALTMTLAYDIFSQLQIRLKLLRGLNPIYREDYQYAGQAKLVALNLGLAYQLRFKQ